MEELIKAINNYRYLVELNLGDKTLEHTPIARELDYQVMKAQEKLKNKNLTINVKCEMPDVKEFVNEFADEFAKKLKASIKCTTCR